MKKMSIFGLLALLVLSVASVAQAADIKATGTFAIESQWNNDIDYSTLSQNKSMHIEQRIRTAFQFIANENLKGVLETQIGSEAWGHGMFAIGAGRTPASAGNAGANTGGNGNIMLRKGYIDFKWPGTKVNFITGFQTVSLPSAFGGGSAILDDQVAAAVVSAPITDNVKVLAGFARAGDTNGFGSATSVYPSGAADVVFAALPIDIQGFNIAPFGAYMYSGAGAGMGGDPGIASSGSGTTSATSTTGYRNSGGVRAYWGGAAFTMTAFDPFKVMADFNYGTANYNNYTLGANGDKGGRQGWLFDVAVDYTGLSMMTPEAFFVYTSGDGGVKEKSGRMPTLGSPQSWTVNNSLFFGDRNFISGFSTTSTGSSYGGYARNVMGFWTAGISLKDIKLIDKLSHQFNVLYAKGTNASDAVSATSALNANGLSYGRYLTEKDHIWEIDLNTKYKVYDELSLLLDLNYVNTDFDKDTWRRVNAAYGNNDMLNSNVYRIAVGMNYSF